MFPSPHGDKFQLPEMYRRCLHEQSFRPLTGINFNTDDRLDVLDFIAFPSPYGDKFQLYDDDDTFRMAVSVPLRG